MPLDPAADDPHIDALALAAYLVEGCHQGVVGICAPHRAGHCRRLTANRAVPGVQKGRVLGRLRILVEGLLRCLERIVERRQ